MPWSLAGLLAALVLAAGGAVAAPLALRDAMGQVDAAGSARMWIDRRGEAGIGEVSRAADSRFVPAGAEPVHKPAGEGVLWLHLPLQRGRAERQDWLLKFPMPVLDHVTVYQRDHLGQWRAEHAGDTLPVTQWPERGRYPVFRLDLPPGESRDVYVRIRHATPTQVPVQLATAAHQSEQLQLEYLGLGAAFGSLLLLIVGCLAKGWAYRDRGFAWYAAYAGLTSLAVAAYTGVAALLLWPGFGALQDAPTPILATAAVGAALLFVRNTLGLRRRLPLQDGLLYCLGVAGLLLAVLPVFASKPVHQPVIGAYITLGSLAALTAAALAWWRGDGVARWVLAAQLPMVLAVVATVFRSLGWAELPALSQYVVVVGLTLEVPLLLVALFIRSRDRHSAQVREHALSTHDPLTGLLAPHLFHDRLSQVVARFRRDGQNAAVMYIELVNHGPIREAWGSAVADQSVLRSVIKLRRLLRDVDTVARVGEARFAVILEGASARSSVTERATRLIAAGLMPLPGLKPDVTLQFHVAALLLSDRPLDAEAIQAVLSEQLARMSARTRRPIRFIEKEEEPGSGDGPESLLGESAASAPEAEAELAAAR